MHNSLVVFRDSEVKSNSVDAYMLLTSIIQFDGDEKCTCVKERSQPVCQRRLVGAPSIRKPFETDAKVLHVRGEWFTAGLPPIGHSVVQYFHCDRL